MLGICGRIICFCAHIVLQRLKQAPVETFVAQAAVATRLSRTVFCCRAGFVWGDAARVYPGEGRPML